MEIEMIKAANGVFVPAYERDLPRLAKFKNGELYTLEAKLTRNPSFTGRCSLFLISAFSTGALNMLDTNSLMKRRSLMSFVKI